MIKIMNKKLLYVIPAKGLGDFICRLNAIYSLYPHFKKIYVVAPKFASEFLNYFPNIEILPFETFTKKRFSYFEKVNFILYASRDHSIFGLLKYLSLFFSFRKNYFKKLHLPSLLYLLRILQFFSREIPKSQNEFYLHQSLNFLSNNYKSTFAFTQSRKLSLKIAKFNENYFFKNTIQKDFISNKKFKKNIIIFPSGQFDFKIWPYYKSLIISLLRYHFINISVIAAKEKELDAYRDLVNYENFFLNHSMNLCDVQKKISNSDLVITNDSGPKHLTTLCSQKHISIDGYFSSWSTVSYCDSCISIFSPGYKARTFFSTNARFKSLQEISPEFVYFLINSFLSD